MEEEKKNEATEAPEENPPAGGEENPSADGEEEMQIPSSLADEAEKPTKLPGKTRGRETEGYRPLHSK
ncbi:hypothetical protein COB64_00335 [Candidatus Wolfebacteria bacterium]|nr:MAG: hypothetical protein COB64_00335 [Candidatus Wolfebacteria bacterium]